MTIEINLIILLFFAFLAGNASFLVIDRIFLVFKTKRQTHRKNPLWHVPEILVFYGLIYLLSYLLESQSGQIHVQNWEFYVVTFCIFIIFGFPSFVYRYLWKSKVQ